MPSTAPDTAFPRHFSLHEPLSNDKESEFSAGEDLTNTITPKFTMDSICDDSQGAFSLVSWCPAGLIDVDEWNTRLRQLTTETTAPLEGNRTTLFSSEVLREEKSTKAKPYQGFPPKLLTDTREENHFLNHLSSTVPRMNSQTMDINLISKKDNNRPRPREESFHDDRALLPSQRKLINRRTAMSIRGTRSSSFWI